MSEPSTDSKRTMNEPTQKSPNELIETSKKGDVELNEDELRRVTGGSTDGKGRDGGNR